ncbi:MAG: hypothetical protein WA793_00345 [Sphingorhabdus sp.]|uniref:hypothetical protein n=1 Tax=Sphingorhabdus sp. TaxID=1902408 RepID=UPI003CA055C7
MPYSGDQPSGAVMARGLGIGMALAITFAANAIMAQTPVVTEKFAVRDGFAFAPETPPRILVFRPEIKIGEQTTAGLFQNNAEWHATATRELSAALVAMGDTRGIEMVLHDDQPADNPLMAEHRALFRLVVGTIIRHKLFSKDPLPSKIGSFDWSLGGGIAKIAPAAKADYGLFLLSHDSFETAGRRAAKLVAALMGNGDIAGTHFGYAALVDLKNGDIVWLGVDLKAGGDVRTAEGAAQRVEQLLNGFPARASGKAVAR